MLIIKNFDKNKKSSMLMPDFIATSVADIRFEKLAEMGITTCLIDLDGTVVQRKTYEVDKAISKAIKKSKLKFYIATNRPETRDLKNLVKDLHARGVIHPKGIFAKPFRSYYLRALRQHSISPQEVVMIGDRYFQDVFGANRVPIHSLLVHRVGHPHTLSEAMFNYIESALTKFISPRYEEI